MLGIKEALIYQMFERSVAIGIHLNPAVAAAATTLMVSLDLPFICSCCICSFNKRIRIMDRIRPLISAMT